jgi:predicted dehydrogenase
MEPVRFGVISTAKIAREKVIPAMQQSGLTAIVGIASRDRARAEEVAAAHGISKTYGSYAEMFADPAIEAVYNPLPNHLHVPIAIEAAAAGKHVLCEKPIALTAEEAGKLIESRDHAGVQITEAFMVRQHPQWLKVRELIRAGRIGAPRLVQMSFSYDNRDPANVRNQAEIGGGALYDIGCYPIVLARFVYGAEPDRVLAMIERDPDFRTDRLTSALLAFPGGAQAALSVSTQLTPYQRTLIFGTEGRIEVEIPVNAPPDRPTRILVGERDDLETITFEVCNQYTFQGEMFARLIRDGSRPEFPLEDAVKNMAVIDALFRSAESGRSEPV